MKTLVGIVPYDLDYVDRVAVVESSLAERFVWQHIKKKLWIVTLNSYSFLQVRQYRSPEGDEIIIDTMTPSKEKLADLVANYDLKQDGSFEKMHIRMRIKNTATGSKLSVKVTGVPKGIAARAPQRILRSELKNTTMEIANAIAE